MPEPDYVAQSRADLVLCLLNERTEPNGTVPKYNAFDRVLVSELGAYVHVLETRLKEARKVIMQLENEKKSGSPSGPWHTVTVMGAVGHSYGVHKNEDGVLVICSKKPNAADWEHNVYPQGTAWLTILGGNRCYTVQGSDGQATGG